MQIREIEKDKTGEFYQFSVYLGSKKNVQSITVNAEELLSYCMFQKTVLERLGILFFRVGGDRHWLQYINSFLLIESETEDE